jgi:hypothetical protein
VVARLQLLLLPQSVLGNIFGSQKASHIYEIAEKSPQQQCEHNATSAVITL